MSFSGEEAYLSLHFPSGGESFHCRLVDAVPWLVVDCCKLLVAAFLYCRLVERTGTTAIMENIEILTVFFTFK